MALRSDHLYFEEENSKDECIVFLLKSAGMVQIPARVTSQDLKPSIQRILNKNPMPVVEEQGICIGGTFWVAAFNGIDLKRKIHFQVQLEPLLNVQSSKQGFCQSPEVLGECVEDVVLDRGGEIVFQQHLMLNHSRRLQMTVSVPYLFGIPPELETLKTAIELGGGLLHRVYGQWYFY